VVDEIHVPVDYGGCRLGRCNLPPRISAALRSSELADGGRVLIVTSVHDLDGRLVERDAPHAMRPSGLLDAAALHLRVIAPDLDDAVRQVEGVPATRTARRDACLSRR
jgi:hypothetical protein